MIQNKITISLFMTGILAVSPMMGPTNPDLSAGTAAEAVYQFTAHKYPLTTKAEKKAISFDGTNYTGLYGCLRSGHVGLPTQKLKVTDDLTNFLIKNLAYTGSTRAFYQTSALDVGEYPTYMKVQADVTGESTRTSFRMPWMIGVTSSLLGGKKDTGGTEAFTLYKAYAGDTFECCVAAADVETTATCLTYVSPGLTSAGVLLTTPITAVSDRIAIFTQAASGTTFLKKGTTGYVNTTKFDVDFILGAMAQQQTNTLTTKNWCSGTFKTVTSATETTVKAQTGFNAKTKCTWQLTSSASTKAPQFKIKDPSTNTSTSNYQLQWIDVSLSATMGNMILPTTSVLVGKYAVADGIFFNPITVKGSNIASTFTTVYAPTANDQGFGTGDKLMAGSPGKFTLYTSSGTNSLHYESTANVSQMPDNSRLKTFYTAYDAAVLSFNALATPYNTARTAKTAAIAAKKAEKDIPKVPVRPCKPTPLPAVAGYDYVVDPTVYNQAKRDTESKKAVHKSKDVYIYVPEINAITAALSDTQRKGYLYPDLDTGVVTYEQKYNKDANVGHVFGRFGQGAMSMPGMTAPFKFGVNTVTTELNTIQVSIFPDGGTKFIGAVTAFSATQSIDISHSEATLGVNTSVVKLPTSSAAALVILTAVDFASVISLSAVAMAATAATLY